MKKYAWAAGLLCWSGTVFAQYDSSYGSTYYRQKVTQFRSIPDMDTGEIIFLGDSITDIAEWSELFKNPAIKNRGISGDKTAGILNRLQEVTDRKPARIFIMIGINDIAEEVPDSLILANYTQIIQRIQSASPITKLYVQSILPTNDTFTEFARHQHKDAHIQAINQQLKILAAQRACTYVDLYTFMCDRDGKLSSAYTNDGLHLTGAGYQVWKGVLQRKKLVP
jgi:lysophospholipase L1-like esterase